MGIKSGNYDYYLHRQNIYKERMNFYIEKIRENRKSLIEDCTQVTWLFLLKRICSAIFVIPNFYSVIQNQDNILQEKRLLQSNLVILSNSQDIITIHHALPPQQNGVAERKNGHSLNTTWALLLKRNIPKSNWRGCSYCLIHDK